MPRDSISKQKLVNEQPTCPHCGAPLTDKAPRGLCPRCLIELGQDFDATESLPSAGEGKTDDPPSFQPIAGKTFGDYELREEIAQTNGPAATQSSNKACNIFAALL
jgi:hypothetical protein